MKTEKLQQYLDGVKFDFQKGITKDTSRRKHINKPRRTGVSWNVTGDALLHSVKTGSDWGIVANKLSTAQTQLDYIRRAWIPLLNGHGANIKVDLDNRSELVVKIPSHPGEFIKFLASSTNVDGIRGETLSILWDEAAYLPTREQERVKQALFPMSESQLTPWTVLWIVSTPAGPSGVFYEIAEDLKKDEDEQQYFFSGHKFSIWDAIRQGFPFDEEKLRRMNPNVRAREYENSFLSMENAFYDRSVLEGLETVNNDELLSTDRVTFGIDLGKKNDLTSVVVRHGTHYSHTYLIDGLDYVDQVPLIDDLVDQFEPKKIFVDATRTEMVSEILIRKYSRSRVKPVHATQKWKVDTIESLDEQISRGRISFDYNTSYEYDTETDTWTPKGHRPLLMDTLLLEQAQTRNGSLTYRLARDDSGHGDSYAAAVLAHDAFRKIDMTADKVKVKAKSRSRNRRTRL